MPSDEKKYEVNRVEAVLQKLFFASGLDEKESEIVVHCLLEAELCGIVSHGLQMVPAHVKKLRDGYMVNENIAIEKQTPAFTVCNANNIIGMVSAWQCMEIAIEKAKSVGMHMVLCHGCNTFSAAYSYVKKSADEKMIGIVFSNSPAQMAPFGGKEKLLGTNPLAISVPANEEAPFIFDMATSIVAKSKINMALKNGEKIPDNWATDMEGNPTTDPMEAVKGMVMPMAGPKGYGLSMAIDLIAGMLSHASYLDGVNRFYSNDNKPMNVGHAFIAINPEMVYGEEFYQETDKYFKRIRCSEGYKGAEVLVPGDINDIEKRKKYNEGITLDKKLVDEINEMLSQCGITDSSL